MGRGYPAQGMSARKASTVISRTLRLDAGPTGLGAGATLATGDAHALGAARSATAPADPRSAREQPSATASSARLAFCRMSTPYRGKRPFVSALGLGHDPHHGPASILRGGLGAAPARGHLGIG